MDDDAESSTERTVLQTKKIYIFTHKKWLSYPHSLNLTPNKYSMDVTKHKTQNTSTLHTSILTVVRYR